MSAANTSSPSFQSDSRKAIETSDLIHAFWRGKWLIIFATIGAIFIGGYYAFVKRIPIYESSTVVILDPDKEQLVAFQSLPNTITGNTPEANSEVEILRARNLMYKVVQHLDLMNDPEFNRTLTPPARKVVIKSKIKQELGWATPLPELSKSDFDQRSVDIVVSQLLSKVRIENLRKSNVFRITALTKDATKAARIADTIAELYIENQVNRKTKAAKKATAWLDKRVKELQIDLEYAETKASDFSAATALVSIEELQQKKRQLKDVRARISAAQQTSTSVAYLLEGMKAAQDNATKTAITGDDILRQLEQDPSQKTAFDDRFKKLFMGKVAEFAQLEEQLSSLKASVIELTTQITQQGQDLIRLQQLNREAQATRVLYEHFLTRLKENASQEGIQSSDSRILSPAVIPFRPTEPRKHLIVSMSGIFGFSLSVFLILISELRRNTFLSLRAIGQYSNLPALAQFLEVQSKSRPDFLDDLNQKPENAYSNAIRRARTTLMLNPRSVSPKVIAVTSCLFEESTAAISLALARDFVRLGSKVLLIDTDLKMNGLREYFGDAPTRGIVSVLRGEHEIDQSVHHPEALGADVLFAEDRTVIASDLFLPQTFSAFIEEIKDQYDHIIINTPSVISIPPTRIITKYADTVILVAKWNSTTKSQINITLDMLKYAAISLSGVILSTATGSADTGNNETSDHFDQPWS